MPKAKVEVHPSTVRLTIHDPIPTAGYSRENAAELVTCVREQVLSALDN
jgi:hypothetical protein